MKRLSNVKLLYWHNFLLYFRPYDPLAILYFNEITGNFAAAMGIFAATQIASVLFEIPTGVISDRIGRKKTFIFGSATAILAITAYALATSSFLLIIGALLEGSARTFFSGTRNALIYETLKEEGREKEYHHDLGKASSFVHVGLGIGALAAIPFTDISLRTVFFASIFPQIVALLLCFLLHEPKIHLQEKQKSLQIFWEAFKKIWHNKKLRTFTLAQSLARGTDYAGFRFRGAFIETVFPLWGLSVITFIDHIASSISYWFAGKAIDKITPKWVVMSFEALNFVSISLAILLKNMVSSILLILPAFAYGTMMTAKEQLIQDEFTDAQRATMGSIGQLLQAFCYMFVALFIGFLADLYGPAVGLFAAVAIQFAVTPLYAGFFKREA